MQNELKPCPFCNSTENLIVISCIDDCCDDAICENCPHEIQYTVCCNARESGCGATSGYAETEEKAIEKWNRRVENAE